MMYLPLLAHCTQTNDDGGGWGRTNFLREINPGILRWNMTELSSSVLGKVETQTVQPEDLLYIFVILIILKISLASLKFRTMVQRSHIVGCVKFQLHPIFFFNLKFCIE